LSLQIIFYHLVKDYSRSGAIYSPKLATEELCSNSSRGYLNNQNQLKSCFKSNSSLSTSLLIPTPIFYSAWQPIRLISHTYTQPIPEYDRTRSISFGPTLVEKNFNTSTKYQISRTKIGIKRLFPSKRLSSIYRTPLYWFSSRIPNTRMVFIPDILVVLVLDRFLLDRLV
jgi:hypothetical protein